MYSAISQRCAMRAPQCLLGPAVIDCPRPGRTGRRGVSEMALTHRAIITCGPGGPCRAGPRALTPGFYPSSARRVADRPAPSICRSATFARLLSRFIRCFLRAIEAYITPSSPTTNRYRITLYSYCCKRYLKIVTRYR